MHAIFTCHRNVFIVRKFEAVVCSAHTEGVQLPIMVFCYCGCVHHGILLVPCAVRNGVLMQLREGDDDEVFFHSFCKKHRSLVRFLMLCSIIFLLCLKSHTVISCNSDPQKRRKLCSPLQSCEPNLPVTLSITPKSRKRVRQAPKSACTDFG